MQMMKKTKSIALPAFRLLLVAALILSMIPVNVYAYVDNEKENTMPGFPAAGSTDTEMENNNGTIQLFYSNGHIINNYGSIEHSGGEINENYGTVKELNGGHVGTNYGTIEKINNTAILTINDEAGLVKENLTTIERNYGSITSNYGKVTMYSGEIEENGQFGTVVFDGLVSQGTISANAGTVTINGSNKQINIASNTGTITINGGTVTVEDNAGTIILGDKANLTCINNSGTITKSENAKTYFAKCTYNFGGQIFEKNSAGTNSTVHNYSRIVFSGDDGKASVAECEAEYRGVKYTENSSMLVITLPADYVCTNTDAVRDETNPNTWHWVTYFDAGNTAYTVTCEKLIPHTHSFTYSCDGNEIKATCTGGGDCKEGYKTAPLTLTLAADGGVYNGEPYTASTDVSTVKFAEITGATVDSIVYTEGAKSLGNTAPTDAGNYTASVTVTYDMDKNVTAAKDFTVTKAASTVTAPTAIADLTYNGQAQALIAAGIPNGGELQYKLGTDGGYSMAIPTAKDAGTYTVYYKVIGDGNHGDTPEASVNVTIAKKPITVRANDKHAYAGTALPELGEDDFTVTGLVNGDELTTKPALAYGGTPDMKKAGTYPVLASDADAGSNYTITYEPGTLTVTYYDPTVTVPVSGEESSVTVKATVSGKTATVQPINESEIEKVIGNDVETGMVTVDLSGLKQDVTAVKLPTETVAAIAEAAAETENDTAGLALKFASGTLEFDAKALETIAEAAGDAKNIEIHFDEVGTTRLNADQKAAVSEMFVVEGFEAYVTVNGTRVSDFGGGSVVVYIPFEIPEGNNPAGYTVWYVAEDGTLEKMNATYDGTNHRFVVSHFSDYVLTYDETAGAYNNCPKDETCPASKFTDVNVTAWYHDGIHFCVETGIMKGVADTKFDVTGDITRAQIVTMLWRLDGEKYANYAMTFADVPAEEWYTEAIRWAASEKIVEGYDTKHFGPTDPVTREQLTTILYRYAKYKGQGFTGSWMFLLDFVDRADISEWADEAVHWCSMKGIVTGKDGKVFDPQGNASRAEAACMMQRFCEALEK